VAAAPPMLRVLEREVVVFRKLWRGTAFSSFVTPVMFLAAIGLGLGGLVQRRTGHVGGVSYLAFVAPGLLAASAMQTAAGSSLWPVMAGTKWVRTFHAVVATPLRPADLYGGTLLWVGLRATAAAGAFLLVAAGLGGIPSPWGILAVPAAALGALAFAAPLAAYAATQDTDLTFPVIIRLGVVPLFLFSGTFFPISQLPPWLRPVSVASPLWHAIELCREATTGTPHWAAAAGHTAVLVGCVAVGWRWGTYTFARRLTP